MLQEPQAQAQHGQQQSLSSSTKKLVSHTTLPHLHNLPRPKNKKSAPKMSQGWTGMLNDLPLPQGWSSEYDRTQGWNSDHDQCLVWLKYGQFSKVQLESPVARYVYLCRLYGFEHSLDFMHAVLMRAQALEAIKDATLRSSMQGMVNVHWWPMKMHQILEDWSVRLEIAQAENDKRDSEI